MSRRRPPLPYRTGARRRARGRASRSRVRRLHGQPAPSTGPGNRRNLSRSGRPHRVRARRSVTLAWTGTAAEHRHERPDNYEVTAHGGRHDDHRLHHHHRAHVHRRQADRRPSSYRVVARVGGWTRPARDLVHPRRDGTDVDVRRPPAVNAAGWVQSTNPQITISATDAGGSGVQSVSYKIGGSDRHDQRRRASPSTSASRAPSRSSTGRPTRSATSRRSARPRYKIDGIAPDRNTTSRSPTTPAVVEPTSITNVAAQNLSGTI